MTIKVTHLDSKTHGNIKDAFLRCSARPNSLDRVSAFGSFADQLPFSFLGSFMFVVLLLTVASECKADRI
jgi:uncharacterized protein (DUF2062 family)